MTPDGKAENGLEQLLWAYALGKANGSHTSATLTVTTTELWAMYDAVAGVRPPKPDLMRWVDAFGQLLPGGSMRVVPIGQAEPGGGRT